MNKILQPFSLVGLGFSLFWVFFTAFPTTNRLPVVQQQDAGQEMTKEAADSGLDKNQVVIDRIQKLETRVASLERILFSTSKLAVNDARRMLKESERKLEQSEELYLKGFICCAIATGSIPERFGETGSRISQLKIRVSRVSQRVGIA